MCQLSTNIKNSDKTSLKTISKIFANIKENHCCVRYQKLGNESDLHSVIYSDAAHGNLPNGRSRGGYVIFLCGRNRMCSPLNWQSKRIRRIVLNSFAAETLALSDALDDVIYLRKLFSEIMFNDNYDIPIEIIIDNKSLYDALFSKKNVIEKCLRIDIAFIKENLEKKIITKIHHVPTGEQLVFDMLINIFHYVDFPHSLYMDLIDSDCGLKMMLLVVMFYIWFR